MRVTCARSPYVYLSTSLGCKRVARRSVHPKGGIERLEESCIAERLEQAVHSPLIEQSWTDDLISLSCNKYDRNLFPRSEEHTSELGTLRHLGFRLLLE